MISYSLAKELKEAGFEENPSGATESPDSWVDSQGKYLDFPSGADDTECYVPTLSELIEACGDRFNNLERRHISRNADDRWLAVATSKGETPYIYCFGSSAEEAIANLYIEINKKP